MPTLMKKVKNMLSGGKHKKGEADSENTVTYPPAKTVDTQDAAVVDAHDRGGNVLSHPADGTTVVAAVLKDKTAAPFTDKAGVATEDKHHRPHLLHHGHHHKDGQAPLLQDGAKAVGAPVPLKQDFASGMGQTTVAMPASAAVNQMHDESELALRHAEEAARAARDKVDEAAKRTTRPERGAPSVAFAPGTAAGAPAVVETITTTTTATIGGGAAGAAPAPGVSLQVVKEAAVAGVEKTKAEAATGLQQAQEALVAGRDMIISATNTGLEKVKENVAWAAEKAKENTAWGVGKTQEAATASKEAVVDTSTPIIERAKENTAWAADQAKQSAIATKDAVVENGAPVVERAKENTAWGMEKAKENAIWLAEKAKEEAAWAAQKAQEAYAAGRGLVQDVMTPPTVREVAAEDVVPITAVTTLPAPVEEGFLEPPQHDVVDETPREVFAPQEVIQEVIVPVQHVYVEQPPVYVQQPPVFVTPVLAAQQLQAAVGVVPAPVQQSQPQAGEVDSSHSSSVAQAAAPSQQQQAGGGMFKQSAMDAVTKALAAVHHTADKAEAASGKAAQPTPQYDA